MAVMAETPPRSATRVIALLGLLLIVALALVVWLAMRPGAEEPAAPKPQPSLPVEPAQPKAPKTRSIETIPLVPKVDENERYRDKPRPDAVPKPTLKFDVEVQDGGGRPAPGAFVALLDPFALRTGGAAKPVELTRRRADDKGHAVFEAVARTVRVLAWLGYESGTSEKVRISDVNGHLTVRMSAGIAVRGHVVDGDGSPVAGAAVRFVAVPWDGDPFGFAIGGDTVEDGTFELPLVPAASLDAVPPGGAAVEARAKGYPMTRVPVSSAVLRNGDLEVRLERGGFLRGRLVASSGEALPGRVVRTVDERSSARSGGDGRFELPMPRDGGRVLVMPPGAGGQVPQIPDAPVVGYLFRGAAKSLGFIAGGDVDLGDIVMPDGHPVKGAVVDLEEKPMKAADVALYLEGQPIASTQTDDLGKFVFEDVGDDLHVLQAVEAPGDNSWAGRRHTSVDGVKGGAADLHVVLTGALSVVVKFQSAADRSAVVVPEVTLRAAASGATPKEYGWTWAGTRIDSVRFEVEHAGSYDVTVELPGYLPATAEDVLVSPDREVSISVLFEKKP